MLNKEYYDYLGLMPKNNKQIKRTTVLKIKPTKKIFKFLSRIPYALINESEALFGVSKLFKLKNDPTFRKYKYIGGDYERFINNDNYVEPDILDKKRDIKSRETGLSRSGRFLKREMKKISINVKKLSLEEILNYNISTKTRELIEKFLNKQPLEFNQIDDDLDDQAIYVETRFKELTQYQLSIYNDENTILKQYKNANHNNDCKILCDFACISSENFFEKSTIISQTTPIKLFKSDQNVNLNVNNNRPSSIKPFQESNRNNQIDIIDLTDC